MSDAFRKGLEAQEASMHEFENDANAAKPRWEVIRVTETLDYFEGIEADNSEEARRKWLEGEGKLNPDRQELPPWTLKVVRVG